MASDIVSILVPTTGAVPLPWNTTVTLINYQATNKVYIGSTAAVTASNGVALPDGTAGTNSGVLTLTSFVGPLYAIAATGATTIGIIAS